MTCSILIALAIGEYVCNELNEQNLVKITNRQLSHIWKFNTKTFQGEDKTKSVIVNGMMTFA